jgi:hypothetical protein
MYVDGMAGMTEVAEQVGSDDPAVGLAGVRALRELLERLEVLHVDAARAAGWSWEDIGRGLGVSKQAVHKKHSGARRLRRRR